MAAIRLSSLPSFPKWRNVCLHVMRVNVQDSCFGQWFGFRTMIIVGPLLDQIVHYVFRALCPTEHISFHIGNSMFFPLMPPSGQFSQLPHMRNEWSHFHLRGDMHDLPVTHPSDFGFSFSNTITSKFTFNLKSIKIKSSDSSGFLWSRSVSQEDESFP